MRTLLVGLLFLAGAPDLAADQPKKADSKTHRVPYRLTNTNHVLVRVKINGKGPYNFLLDTGAPALFVSTSVARKLGVEANKQGWGTFDRFEVEGGVVLKQAKGRVEDPFQLEGMNGLGLAGVELHGIIGYTILARYRLEFDFTKDKMDWKPLDFRPPAPEGLGEGSAATGLEAIGTVMKLLGGVLGRKTEQEVVLRGFLGVALADKDDGVQVQSVLANSPAAESGLTPGDRITRFQGKSVSSAAAVRRLASKLGADETAELTVTREGAKDSIQVRIKAGRGL
jgi:serine protease DegQ